MSDAPRSPSEIQLADVPIPLLRQAILTQANIPVPTLEICKKRLFELIEPDPKYGEPKNQSYINTQKSIFEKNLKNALSTYSELSIRSTSLIAKHATEMTNILYYAKCLFEFDEVKNQKLVEKYKRLYLQAKADLQQKLGEKTFAECMHNCMEASSSKGHELFGILFYADSYCEPELQHVADIANATRLSKMASRTKTPFKVYPNLFGEERDYRAVQLKAGIGHIMLPVDPAQSDTVYVVCPNLEKLEQEPERILAQLQQGAGQAVFAEVQEAIQTLDAPEGWRANIKVFGENRGAQIAAEYFTAIQTGLSHQLEPISQTLNQQAVQAVRQKWGQNNASQLVTQVQSLSLEEVQTSPFPLLVSPEVRQALPGYNQFLSNSRVAQGLGVANFVLNEFRGPTARAIDENLQQYHHYKVVRPALVHVAQSVMPIINAALVGAALGSVVPGVGTALGAAIGAGVAAVGMIFKGYMLWKMKKEESLKAAALEQGLEMQSSFERLGALPSPQARTLRFSPTSSTGKNNSSIDSTQAESKAEMTRKKRSPKKIRMRRSHKPHLPDRH